MLFSSREENMEFNSDNGKKSYDKTNYWKDVYFEFRYVYRMFLIIGTILLIICIGFIWIQKHYKATINSSLKNKRYSHAISDIEPDNINTQSDDIYSQYVRYYKNHKDGVSKSKAKKIMKKYVCHQWKNGVRITKKKILINEKYKYTYHVLHIRHVNKKTIRAYLKLTSGDAEGRIVSITVNRKKGKKYTMKMKVLEE